jgi:hypothetical protein
MALALKAEPGESDSNTYATLAQAESFFERRIHADVWTAADDDVKKAALVWATRLLDENVDWFGYPVYEDQKLRFPRTGLSDVDGNLVDDTVIPQFLVEAVAEFAFHLIGEDRTLETNRDLIGLKRVKVDVLSITTDTSPTAVKPIVPLSVWSMIKFYGQPFGRTLRLVRC